jgi:Tfp pilus assembly protein PilF
MTTRYAGILTTGLLISFSLCGCASWSSGLTGHKHTGNAALIAEKSKRLKDPAKLRLKYAQWQESIGDLTEAKDSYEFVLGEKPKSTDALLGMARIDLFTGRVNEAEQGFKKVLNLYPKNPQVLDAVGQFYSTQERWADSVELLTRASNAAPTDKTIRHHLGVALTKSGDPQAAIPHFSQTVGEAESHYNVGLILYELGKIDESEQFLVQAVTMKPDFQQAADWLAEIRHNKGVKLVMAPTHQQLPVDDPVFTRNLIPTGHSFPAPAQGAGEKTQTQPNIENQSAIDLTPANQRADQPKDSSGLNPQQLEQFLNSMRGTRQREQWENQSGTR